MASGTDMGAHFEVLKVEETTPVVNPLLVGEEDMFVTEVKA